VISLLVCVCVARCRQGTRPNSVQAAFYKTSRTLASFEVLGLRGSGRGGGRYARDQRTLLVLEECLLLGFPIPESNRGEY